MNVLLDDYSGRTFTRYLREGGIELFHYDWRQAQGHFVEEQQFRIAHERAPDCDCLLLTT